MGTTTTSIFTYSPGIKKMRLHSDQIFHDTGRINPPALDFWAEELTPIQEGMSLNFSDTIMV